MNAYSCARRDVFLARLLYESLGYRVRCQVNVATIGRD